MVRARVPSGRDFFLRDLVVQTPPRPTAAARPDRRQVLLISIDTLRADALSALGGPWPTPRLDRFAARAETFTRHYAAAAWTKPSHASLLTGHAPAVHGAGEDVASPIRPGLALLAERFRDAGFRTKGLVTECVWLRPGYGFGRGFGEYDSVPWTPSQMARRTASWMAAHGEEDFFFFLHLFDVHSDFWHLPYEAPGVQRTRVGERFGLDGYGCRAGLCASHMLLAMREGRLAPQPGEDEILRFLYGGGVRHLDETLGQLLTDLDLLGLLDDMLIVLTSDHGEALLERGRVLHGAHWEPVLRVPLAIKWPRGGHAGERRDEPTSALDVAPTLLAAFGLGRPGASGVRPAPRAARPAGFLLGGLAGGRGRRPQGGGARERGRAAPLRPRGGP